MSLGLIKYILSCIWSKTGSGIRSVKGKIYTVLVESFLFRNGWWRTTFLVLWWVWCRTDISLYCLVCSNSVSLLCPCRVRYPTSLYLALEGESEPWLDCWAPCPRWESRGFWTLPSTWVVSLDQHGRHATRYYGKQGVLLFSINSNSKKWGLADEERGWGSAGKMDKEGVENEGIADSRWKQDLYSRVMTSGGECHLKDRARLWHFRVMYLKGTYHTNRCECDQPL